MLSLLEDDHGFEVESVARKGHRVEDMAYGRDQLAELTKLLEKLLRRSDLQIPRAILLSGGGNDVAGQHFGVLLNHARSRQSGLNDSIVSGVIDDRIRDAYVTILSAVTAICRERIGRTIPIIVHGYAYAVPDGRGFMGGFGPLPGPWLEPGLREKGFDPRGDLDGCTELVVELMDRFNAMLAGIAALPAFGHVRYLDLREELSNGPGYKRWWANELHPTPRGFAAVADRFAAAIP